MTVEFFNIKPYFKGKGRGKGKGKVSPLQAYVA